MHSNDLFDFPKKLTVLHTSDWHLGRRLYNQNRDKEYQNFLSWLIDTIKARQVDILIIAGDIFDTMTPSNAAQNLYYHFLHQIAASCCQHVIIIGGNHDSPSFLEAPKDLLKILNIHIIGMAAENLEDEVITLYDTQQQAQAIIMAIPYLRERDIRLSVAGESQQDKNQQIQDGIRQHYQDTYQIALKHQQQLSNNQPNKAKIPIIATGHLFTSHGKVSEDDGVRDLYVGSLGHVPVSIFASGIDYVALGHLHVPQLVNQQEHIRYCGSPIAIGFGECTQQKQVCLIEFTHNHNSNNQPNISTINVPCFQKLQQIKGDWKAIQIKIAELKRLQEEIWLEVTYNSTQIKNNLREEIEKLIEDSLIKVLKLKNPYQYKKILSQHHATESLQDMSPNDVFERCLKTNNIDPTQQIQLKDAYQQILYKLHHHEPE